MALSLSTAVKDKVALLLWSATYAALGTGYQQSLIDGEGASSLTEVETLAQWFTMDTAAAKAPDEFEPWFVSKIVARIERNAHPDRAQLAQRTEDRAMLHALERYARRAMTYSPSSSESFVFNTINTRTYVLNHCLRLKPALFPTIESVDSAMTEILTDIWNRGMWAFDRRPVRIDFNRTAFTGGTYTESTKTIAVTGATASLPVGTRFYVTGGTGATTGDYAIASTTATTIVLTSSIGSAADAQTDIAGYYVIPAYHGLGASELFDSIATTMFVYTDNGNQSAQLEWLTSDDFARARAADGSNTGRPRYFRTHEPTDVGTVFLFSPPPDQTYTVMGEVLVRQAANPTSTTDTIPFASFCATFMPGIRRAVLDRVLTNYGRTNQQLHKEVTEEIEERFPQYQDPGEPDNRVGVRDVYHDRADQSAGAMWLAGGEGAI